MARAPDGCKVRAALRLGSLGGAGFRAWGDLGGIGCSFTTTSFMALGCSLLEFREFRVRQFQV